MVREVDISSICPYCSASVSKRVWKTDFDINTHYRTLNCECGRKISVKLDFISSGEWENHHNQTVNEEKRSDGKVLGKCVRIETLENKIKIVKEYQDNFVCQGKFNNGRSE